MKITLVKKVLLDGSPCRKCGEVIEQLEKKDQMRFIDEVLVADERDPASPGMLLAADLGVDRAPFFVVRHDNGREDVYTVYLKFANEVLGSKQAAPDVDRDILDSNDLDFL